MGVGDSSGASTEIDRLRRRLAQLETEHASATRRLERLSEGGVDGLLLLEAGVVAHANDRACALLGRPRHELLRPPFGSWLPSEEAARLTEAVARATAGAAEPVVLDLEVASPQARARHVRIFIRAAAATPEAASGHVVTVRDQSEHQAARETLKGRERFLADVFASIQDGISVLDCERRILRTNAAMERWYAHAMPLVGKTCHVAYHGRLEQCDLCPTRRTLETSRPAMETVPRRDAAGNTIGWQDLYTFPLFDQRTGKLEGVIEYVRDITERKRAEAERDRLFAYSVDMLCVLGFDGVFKQTNPACTQTLGWSADELVGAAWIDFVHEEEVAAARRGLEAMLAGELLQGLIVRSRCRDGTFRWISWNAFPVAIDQLIYCVGRDITDQRRLEDQLRQAHKMEAVGRLAAGVAHDFNNLLTPIIGYSDLALMSIGPGDRWHEELNHILAAANHAQELTKQLLAFGRKQVLQVRSVDLSASVHDAVPMLRRLIPESIEIELRLEPSAGAVRADPGQLVQIVLNLAINAAESMPDGGRLALETRTVHVDEDFARTHVGVEPGDYCVLSVTDTGSGMDAATVQRAFEPFFSTKERGTGTGLGLAVVHGIVKQHGGHIWLESKPGEGATFRIYLPRAGTRPPPRPSQPAPSSPRGLGEAVLVVEDSPAVRRLAVLALEHVGYRVLAAGSAEEAIDLVGGGEVGVDLLLTDVVLPGMNGRRLYEQLAPVLPALRVVYMSGYTDNVIARHGILDEGTRLLQKPFSVEHLVRMVQRALAADPPERSD